MSKKKHSATTSADKERKNRGANMPWSDMTWWIAFLSVVFSFLYSDKTQDSNVVIRYGFVSLFSLLFIARFYLLGKNEIRLPGSILVKSVFALSIGFGVWSLLSMILSVNITMGYYETGRHLLNIIVMFLVMQAVMKEDFDATILCKGLLLVSLVHSFIGIMQFYDLAFADLPGNYKPYGLMANRNLFGTAQMLLLPFVVFVLWHADRKWKYLSGVALAGIIVSVIISQTRSAWVGTVVFAVVSLILVLLFLPDYRKKWIIGSSAGIIGAIALTGILVLSDGGGLFSESLSERVESFTKNEDSNASEESISDRLQIWQQTVKLIKDYPLTGVGPGNWKIAVLQYGSEQLVWRHGFYVPDNAHSVYLQVLSETGIPGALLYFGVWILLFIIAFKIIKSAAPVNVRVITLLLTGGLASFTCISIFLFPTERIEHSCYLLLMAGIILGIFSRTFSENREIKTSIKNVLVVTASLIIAFNLFIAFEKYNFETHTMWVKAYKNAGKHSETIREANKGKSPFVSLDQTGNSLEWYSSEAYRGLKQYDKALEQANIARALHPNSARILNTLGNIHVDLRQFDKAVAYYEKALIIIPEYEIVQKNLAYNYYNVGKYEQSIGLFAKLNIEGDEYSKRILSECQRRVRQTKKP